MTYVDGRPTLDADSHLMELPGFLDPFIEATMRERLRGREMASVASLLDHATAAAGRRRDDPAAQAEAEDRLLVDKGWSAMGAFDPAERSRVVDLLGVDGQLVFATFATAMFMGRDRDLLHAGSAAHNRAVAAFCAEDPRLLPVGFIPLVDTSRAVVLLEEAIALGCAAVHVPSTAAGDRSPTHPDLDPFWALLEGSGLPFVLHVGGGGRLLDRAFHDNGRPVTDHLGGRREHPLEGLPRHPRLPLALPRRHGPRRHVRPLPGPAGRGDRGGSRLGRVLAAPDRLRPACLPPHRGPAGGAHPDCRRSTCPATCGSRPSRASRWAG